MKLREIFNIAGTIIGTANPVVGGAILAVNKLLPSEDKLPMTATVEEVKLTMASKVSEEDRQTLLDQEIELEMKKEECWTDIQRMHNETDASGASTRPWIALGMAGAVIASVVPISLSIAWAIIKSDNPLQDANDNYLLVLTLLATPTALLRSYFGMRSKEKTARYAASVGQTVNPAGVIASFLGGRK